MPIFTLVTNVSQTHVTPEILKAASKFVSQLFDVTEETVLVSIKADVQMAWGTKPGTFALGTIQSTTPILAEDTTNFAPAVFDFVEQKLGIPQNRMYLGFTNLNSDNIAFDSKLYCNINDDE